MCYQYPKPILATRPASMIQRLIPTTNPSFTRDDHQPNSSNRDRFSVREFIRGLVQPKLCYFVNLSTHFRTLLVRGKTKTQTNIDYTPESGRMRQGPCMRYTY